ncbi:MAG: hypothetical protein P8J14_00845, partial [Emcibacteraceae bacterium]|nr:hypothetical protein [Emcibacteraceae bacterium]
MFGNSYDPTTILFMLSMTFTFLLVVFGFIAHKNSDIKGIKWWLLFSLFLTLSTDVTLYSKIDSTFIVPRVFYFLGSISYLFL